MTEPMPELVEALAYANGSGRESTAWTALTTLVGTAVAADPEVARAWRRVRGVGADRKDVQELASALARHAEADGDFRERLHGWAAWRGGGRPIEREQANANANVIGDSAQIWGASVQARDIVGGIHIHQEAPAAPRTIPRQLLPVSAHFTGRDDDLAALDALRAERDPTVPQVIVVSGPGGVGKTALASRWLRDHEAEFTDGQLYADLRGFASGESPSAGEVLGGLLRALGHPDVPATLPEQATLWRSLTASLRFALMLDNAVTAAQVRILLPSAPGSLVVVTSRHRLTGLVTDGAVFHQLGLLDRRSAVELLARGTGRKRVDLDRSSAYEVVSLCACLPLAICLAAARLAARPGQPMAAMAAALKRGPGPMGALRVEGTRTLQTMLDESYEALGPDEAVVYRRLGLLPVPDFDAPLVAAVCALDEAEADRLLDALAEANLLEETGSGGYRFHDLVRLHAAQRGTGEESASTRTETLRRLVDWCLAMATSAEALLTPIHRNLGEREYEFPPAAAAPFDGERDALAWLDTHRETLMAALRAAADARWHVAAWQLTDALWPLFLRLRLYDSWIEAHQIGLDAARHARDRAGEARMLTSGGIGLRMTGRYDEGAGWYTRALELAQADANPRDEAQALSGLGSCSRGAGRLAQAADFFARALALREAIGYRRGAALSRLRLGEIAFDQERYETAIDNLTRAHADLVAEHDRYDATRARALLGFALARHGSRDAGEGHLHQALADFEESGSQVWRGRTLEMLGQLAAEMGDRAGARAFYERARAIFGAVSPVDGERVERRLGDVGDPGSGPVDASP
jgi:tetratricopeptide (TPR) repeat protein